MPTITLREILTLVRMLLIAFGVSEATATSDEMTRLVSACVAVGCASWSMWESRKHARLKTDTLSKGSEAESSSHKEQES